MLTRDTILKAERGDEESAFSLALDYYEEGAFFSSFYWMKRAAAGGKVEACVWPGA